MLHRSRSKDYAAGDGTPSTAYFSKQQESDFLANLRNNRPARPSGSRPPPAVSPTRTRTSISRDDSYRPRVSTSSRNSYDLSHSRSSSVLSYYHGVGSISSGRSSPDKMFYAAAQRDMEQRESEKDEAEAMRVALSNPNGNFDYDLHSAASQEAGELIWKHQNPSHPYRVQPSRQKTLEAQTARAGNAGYAPIDPAQVADSSELESYDEPTPVPARTADVSPERSPTKRLSNRFSSSRMSGKRRSLSSLRNVSGSIKRAVFPNSKEQIWEDKRGSPTKASPEKPTQPSVSDDNVPVHVRRNPFARAHAARQNQQSQTDFSRSDVMKSLKSIQTDRETHKWNPDYMSNNSSALSPPDRTPTQPDHDPLEQEVRYKNGMEVRSDDIRAATSVRRSDRSARLPSPTVVSDDPTRPIVSFDNDWQPPRPQQHEQPGSAQIEAAVSASSASHDDQMPPLNGPNEPRSAIDRNTTRTHQSVNARSSAGRTNASSASSQQPPRGEPSPTRRGAIESQARQPRSMPARASTLPPSDAMSKEPRVQPSRSQTLKDPIESSSTNGALPSFSVDEPPADTSRQKGASRSVPSIQGPERPVGATDTAMRPPRVEMPSVEVSDAETAARPRRRSSRPDLPSVEVMAEPEKQQEERRQRLPRQASPPAMQVLESGGNVQNSKTGQNGRPNPRRRNPADMPQSEPRPSMRHSETAPAATSRGHWTPMTRSNGALCAQCALPISGRIVTAAGTRFHPECFVCHHCHEALECVAFYPEPGRKREERQDRIERRAAGEHVEPPDGVPFEEDNDDALRFFCHLDYHEFFSPRCKSCKTPIEGEVIVACGASWHVGHFFCAECGDPFSPSIPFVEKDGYAWCINCHTNRSSTRCKKCRKPVTDMVLKALGADWHDECFRCFECDSTFADGKFFLRGSSQDPVCSGCEARRLKG